MAKQKLRSGLKSQREIANRNELPKLGTCERKTGVPSIVNHPRQTKLAMHTSRKSQTCCQLDQELVSEGSILPKRTNTSKLAGTLFRDNVREDS
ncbi:hypothetical protein Nepgr_002620 [Nepenthes gracilis]|uniref:Uncharacterized protein n=1 Tax=Nepenthes gracilis TaxID=150966 RepID=A0AAD3P762_NEPGR|nr:hypothetical protein Nepgr_002620 [Nepenthes gracilis]